MEQTHHQFRALFGSALLLLAAAALLASNVHAQEDEPIELEGPNVCKKLEE